MKRFVVQIMAAVVLMAMAQTAMAQSRTVSSETRTETATVEAIEASTRTITLKKSDGTFVTTWAGPDIKRFEEVKIGDKVNARYYENVVVRLKQPGEPDADSEDKGHDDVFRPAPAWWHHSQATDDHCHDRRHRHEGAVDLLHRAERLEVHVQSAGQGGSRQGEGRRQGRHRLDRSGAGVGRARPVRRVYGRGGPP